MYKLKLRNLVFHKSVNKKMNVCYIWIKWEKRISVVLKDYNTWTIAGTQLLWKGIRFLIHEILHDVSFLTSVCVNFKPPTNEQYPGVVFIFDTVFLFYFTSFYWFVSQLDINASSKWHLDKCFPALMLVSVKQIIFVLGGNPS